MSQGLPGSQTDCACWYVLRSPLGAEPMNGLVNGMCGFEGVAEIARSARMPVKGKGKGKGKGAISGADFEAGAAHAAQYGLRSGESCCPELQSGQGSHEDEDNRSPYCAARAMKREDMGLGQGELGSLEAVRAGVPDPTPKPMSPRFTNHKRATMAKSITSTQNEHKKRITHVVVAYNVLKHKPINFR